MVYLNIVIRIVSIMALLLILVLITGRRKIGELPVFDFLTLIILGAVVGADIADPEIDHLPTAFAVVLLVLFQYVIIYLIIKNRKIGGLLTFGPTVIIQNGQFIKSNMRRLKYSMENVLMYLREKDVFNLNEVEFAIVEDSGNISVIKKSDYIPLTPKDMGKKTNHKGISIPLVVEGKVYGENLKELKLDEKWLANQLKVSNVKSINEAFYVEINSEGELYISKVVEPDGLKNFKL